SARRRREGKALGPLDGIPMLLKDNLNASDMPTTWGSPLFAGFRPERDEIPVERLRQAGAVFMGKTNVPEFTVEGFTANALFGTTRNPWDTALIPGGSSGGSVAAVALGLSPCSVGTDGGGSVRRPASYANLVGLKTSIGRIPRGGGLPQLLLDMETIGPITRTVRDQALILNALSGPDRRDHRSLRFAPEDFATDLDAPLPPLRILAIERIGDAPVDPEIVASFRQMAGTLAELGHDVSTGPLPFDIRPLYDRWTSIADIGLGLLLARNPEMAERASPKYVEWAQRDYPAAHLLEIVEILETLRNDAARAFGGTDIILTPASAAMPWPTDLPFPPEIDGVPAGPRGSALFSGWVNACGHPGISLPGARGASGLPIGMQFVSDFGREALLLRLARQVENAVPWAGDWPPLAEKETRT
ncbi:MAG: amidase, partial [Rhodobacteraceae bacterium]|nr:amidase [Paracoccaceae bacterium]